MTNLHDISVRAMAEIEQWFPRQCELPSIDFYFWYLPATPEHDGGLLIARERPANLDYRRSMRLRRDMTIAQNHCQFMQHYAPQLPVLSTQPSN